MVCTFCSVKGNFTLLIYQIIKTSKNRVGKMLSLILPLMYACTWPRFWMLVDVCLSKPVNDTTVQTFGSVGVFFI